MCSHAYITRRAPFPRPLPLHCPWHTPHTALYPQTGAYTGYSLVWVLFSAILVGLLLQDLSSRVGVVTGNDLAQCSKFHFSANKSLFIYFMMEIAIVGSDIQEVLGSAIAIKLLSNDRIPLVYGCLITGLDTFTFLFVHHCGARYLEAVRHSHTWRGQAFKSWRNARNSCAEWSAQEEKTTGKEQTTGKQRPHRFARSCRSPLRSQHHPRCSRVYVAARTPHLLSLQHLTHPDFSQMIFALIFCMALCFCVNWAAVPVDTAALAHGWFVPTIKSYAVVQVSLGKLFMCVSE